MKETGWKKTAGNGSDGKYICEVQLDRLNKDHKVRGTENNFKTEDYVKDEGYKDSIEYWYLAAEIINEDGDINPAVWAKSKAEAVRKLKKLL